MRILLVRHGPAGKADPKAFPDDDLRPLTPKGREACKRAARGLQSLAVAPEIIFTSPALRTRQSAELLARRLGNPVKSLVDMPELHHAEDPAKALAKLGRMKLPGAVALVGHEPWLGRFLSLLISGGAGARIGLDKGGACLVEAETAKKGKGTLVWLATRDQLSALA